MLSGKKILFIGNSYTYYGNAVMHKGYSVLTQEARSGDQGWFYQLCKAKGINHLIYTGFCVNACLTMSPCGMYDMSRRGVICSVVRDLTTAVENRESARTESNKAYGLWAFSLWGGFVFDQADVENELL